MKYAVAQVDYGGLEATWVQLLKTCDTATNDGDKSDLMWHCHFASDKDYTKKSIQMSP